jgi:hypothetical protein
MQYYVPSGIGCSFPNPSDGSITGHSTAASNIVTKRHVSLIPILANKNPTMPTDATPTADEATSLPQHRITARIMSCTSSNGTNKSHPATTTACTQWEWLHRKARTTAIDKTTNKMDMTHQNLAIPSVNQCLLLCAFLLILVLWFAGLTFF